MSLFFNPDIPTKGTFVLDKTESKHCLKVLRKSAGDQIIVTDGKGYLYTCLLLDEEISGCALEVVSKEQGYGIRPTSLHIAISPVKNPARFEWFLEKATEVGIEKITPVICTRTEKHQVKAERCHNLMISAMKQSERVLLPELAEPQLFDDLFRSALPSQRFVAWCGDSLKPFLPALMEPDADTIILIGPEGDFTPEEIAMATHHGFQPVSLGSARLRTETAGIFACLAFNIKNHKMDL